MPDEEHRTQIHVEQDEKGPRRWQTSSGPRKSRPLPGTMIGEDALLSGTSKDRSAPLNRPFGGTPSDHARRARSL